jgi:hypothetical protein
MNSTKERLLEEVVKLVKSIDSDQISRQAASTEAGAIDAEKERLFKFLWTGPNRLQRVAAALKAPLKERIDYYGIGRQILELDEIPVGELPFRDKDIPEFAAVKVAAFGAPALIEYRIKRIVFPTFQLSRAYRVAYDELLVRLYPVFDRAKERVSIATAIAEDREVFRLLDAASNVGPNAFIDASTGTGGVYLTRSILADALAVIESNQLQVGCVIMHPKRYKDIRKWKHDDLDQVTLNKITETGSVGSILGVKLLVSPKADENAAYVVTTPQKLGLIPLRKDMEVKVADLPWRSAYYVCSYENLGFGIYNTYGVVRIEFNNRVKTVPAGNVVDHNPQF